MLSIDDRLLVSKSKLSFGIYLVDRRLFLIIVIKLRTLLYVS